MKIQKEQPRRTASPQHRSGLRTAALIVLLVTLIFCVWLTGGAVAYGWINHADHYGSAFAVYGKAYYFLGGLMSLGAVLYLFRLDLPALILDVCAYVPMLVILLRAMNTAEENGWSGQTEASFGRQAAQAWRNGMMWNAIPFLLLAALTLTRFFSQDEKVRRHEKHIAKERERNRPAPSILGGETKPAANLRQEPPKTAKQPQKTSKSHNTKKK